MDYPYNPNKEENEWILNYLLLSGYKDLGWKNEGKDFTPGAVIDFNLDLSTYAHRSTHIVYIAHNTTSILRVDMSD